MRNRTIPILRNFLIVIFLICVCPRISKSQTLGGYPVYGYLANAIHPNGCSDGYVAHFPDDSIWVNFANNTFTTGNFTLPDSDSSGYDLLLETGYNLSNYIVNLLLTNGIYSTSHNVIVSDWDTINNFFLWHFSSDVCSANQLSSNHYIVPLDYSLDFGLTASDTVTGIKIEFLQSPGAPDFAGAYLINLQQVGIDEQSTQNASTIFPNPFTDKLNYTTNNSEHSEFVLYDITSRIIFQKKFTGSLSLNTEQLSKGIYFYEVRNENGPDSYRVIKIGKVLKD